MSEEKCVLEDKHTDYIDYEKFQNKAYFEQLSRLLPETKESFPYDEVHKLLEQMSELTGLLLIIGQDGAENCLEYYGTGFIARIRRIRSELNSQSAISGDPQSVSAIVTVTTAYHIFNDDDSEEVNCYKKANEIWKKYKTEFKLNYNVDNCGCSDNGGDHGSDDSKDDPDLKKVKNLPTLYGHRLLETDKDLNYKSDWCSIECTTSDIQLIEKLETNLSKFQSSLADLYELSKMHNDVNLVVIIGHPHYWPKTFSIGQSRKEKEILKEIRSYQTWCRYGYDNVVCDGISGAPIFKWGQPISGFGYWFGHPHNHSELTTEDEEGQVYIGKSTIGAENITV